MMGLLIIIAVILSIRKILNGTYMGKGPWEKRRW